MPYAKKFLAHFQLYILLQFVLYSYKSFWSLNLNKKRGASSKEKTNLYSDDVSFHTVLIV